jgi:hypothetical protein
MMSFFMSLCFKIDDTKLKEKIGTNAPKCDLERPKSGFGTFYFKKSLGARPVKSLKIRLKVVLELKPDS